MTSTIRIGMLGTMENRALPVTVLFMIPLSSPMALPCFQARRINHTAWKTT